MACFPFPGSQWGQTWREPWAYSGNRAGLYLRSGNEPLHMVVHPKGKEVGKERRNENEEGAQPNFAAKEQQVGQKVSLEDQRQGGSFISGILPTHLHHLSPGQRSTYHKCTHLARQQKQANAICQCLPLRICHLQIHHMWQINGAQASRTALYCAQLTKLTPILRKQE